jgi:hypothetical protein
LDRYPGIASVAGKLRARSFTLDGEAVVCGGDGVAVFDALHGRHKAGGAILYAFHFGGSAAGGSLNRLLRRQLHDSDSGASHANAEV